MTPNQYLRTLAGDCLVAAVTGLGFSAELVELITKQLKCPMAIDRMTCWWMRCLLSVLKTKPDRKSKKARRLRPGAISGYITRNGNQMRRNKAMKKFIPKEKLGKKARKQLDNEQRTTWAFSPVTKKVESKKLYNRKRKAYDLYDDYGMGFSYGLI